MASKRQDGQDWSRLGCCFLTAPRATPTGSDVDAKPRVRDMYPGFTPSSPALSLILVAQNKEITHQTRVCNNPSEKTFTAGNSSRITWIQHRSLFPSPLMVSHHPHIQHEGGKGPWGESDSLSGGIFLAGAEGGGRGTRLVTRKPAGSVSAEPLSMLML